MFSVPVIYLRFSPHFLLRPFSPPFPRGRAVLIRSPVSEFREPKGWEAIVMEGSRTLGFRIDQIPNLRPCPDHPVGWADLRGVVRVSLSMTMVCALTGTDVYRW